MGAGISAESGIPTFRGKDGYWVSGSVNYECSRELYLFPVNLDLKSRNKDVLTKEEINLLKCPKCGGWLRPHVLWFDERYNEKHFKSDTVQRISKNTGILFVIGTTLATNLPDTVVRNVLSKGGMVVYVNIDEYEGYLESMENAIIIRENSSDFLIELRNEIDFLHHT